MQWNTTCKAKNETGVCTSFYIYLEWVPIKCISLAYCFLLTHCWLNSIHLYFWNAATSEIEGLKNNTIVEILLQIFSLRTASNLLLLLLLLLFHFYLTLTHSTLSPSTLSFYSIISSSAFILEKENKLYFYMYNKRRRMNNV